MGSRIASARLWVLSSAYAVNLIFGIALLANQMGIQYYYAYVRCDLSITFIARDLDPIIWIITTATISAELIFDGLARSKKIPKGIIILHATLLGSLFAYAFDARAAALICVPFAFSAFAISYFSARGGGWREAKFLNMLPAMTLAIATFILIAIEGASLSSWITNAFDYQTPFGGGDRWIFPLIEMNFSNLLYPVTPLLIIILIMSWLWLPILRRLKPRLSFIERALVPNGGDGLTLPLGQKAQLVLLLFAAALAFFVAYYPYIRAPPPYLAGIDAVYYYKYIIEMDANGIGQAILSDRPLYLLMLHALASLSGLSADVIVRAMPAVSSALLALATFWFVKVGTGRAETGVLAALFSATSFQVTAGMMGYFLAQIFCVIEMIVVFTLLLKGAKGEAAKYCALAGIVSVIAFLTHPYTWVLMAGGIGLYLLALFILDKRRDRGLFLQALPLLATMIIVAVALPYLGGQSFHSMSLVSVLKAIWAKFVEGLGVAKITMLHTSMALMIQRWVGGAFGSPLFYLFSIFGVASMAKMDGFNKLLLCSLIVPSLGILAIVPTYEPLYYRVAYVIPFQVLSALGFCWALAKVSQFLRASGHDRRVVIIIEVLLIVLVVLIFLNYALRITNLPVLRLPK
uniref:Glycosyltransferase RgtA/B/C/D-like domain-containing protein n=1 Tax=Candidatus Methanomethylicus mesodigestus TaxID=1867258 RepID=A0A7C3ESK4_9CREN